MPYGLANAPSVFQAMVNDVLRDMLGRFVITYIDDILIHSSSLAAHIEHVRLVLEKCVFHQTTIPFLGYVIGPEGVKMEDKKVSAVRDWPEPKTVKELQGFLGFSNFYRRFIRGFSSVAAPLTSLLKGQPRRLSWDDGARAAFTQLKVCFTTAPILKMPDP